ncbi:MAG: hypothetical protein GY862_10525 [Gammaproteobacteria bacterium]|nr:hypothetical protein [Gammaproteobacteria bacterium]
MTAIQPEYLPYEVDYGEQEQKFHALIEQHRRADNFGRSRPLICLMPGWANEVTTGMLLERLRRNLQEHRLAPCDSNYKSLSSRMINLFPLNLGRLQKTGELNAALLNSLWENLVSDDGQALDLRKHVFCNPVIFHAHIELAFMNQSAANELLKRFYQFWGDWGDQNHLLLVCVSVSLLEEPCTPWEWTRGGFLRRWSNRRFEKQLSELLPYTGIGLLPTLKPVNKNEVTYWARQLRNRGLSLALFKHLSDEISHLFSSARAVGGCLPMDHLCDRLGAFLDNHSESEP